MAGLMIFAGTDGVGRDGNRNLWVTDGTAAGTKELIIPGAPADGGLSPSGMTVFGSKILFAGNSDFGLDLWVTDGTVSGTKDLRVPGVRGLEPSHIITFGNKAIFAGFDSSGFPNPWVTDGTLGGTHELVPPGSDILQPDDRFGIDPDFTVLGNKVLFVGGEAVRHLWVTDGTPTGTKELAGGAPNLPIWAV